MILRALRGQFLVTGTAHRLSSPRRRGPTYPLAQGESWVPAFAGMTVGGKPAFYSLIGCPVRTLSSAATHIRSDSTASCMCRVKSMSSVIARYT